MSRYFKLSEKPSEGNGKSGAEFEEDARDSALRQVSGHVAAGDAVWHGYELAVELAHGREADARANPACGYAAMAPQVLDIERRFREKAAEEGWRAAERDGGRGAADGSFVSARPGVGATLGEAPDAAGEAVVRRLKEYDEKIAAAVCTSPTIGRLVGAYYVPFLLNVLALSDKEFDAEYPGEGRAGSEERGALLDAILRHAEECPRCDLKYWSDMEWDAYVEKARPRQRQRRVKIRG